MFTNGRKKGTVRFSINATGGAKRAQLVGDFNGWNTQTMRKQKNGGFAATVSLPAGSYEYRFILDGQWMQDPDNGALAMNPYGGFNSVAVVQ
ncbi:MAG: isoamylase early set domain-containing protein [Phycisphaerae bacterium]|nr:isoamylase early set domain-containing protein [Phycisphaerae bacterium]